MGSGSLIYCQEVNLTPILVHFEPVVHRAPAGVMASPLRTIGSSRFSAFQMIARWLRRSPNALVAWLSRSCGQQKQGSESAFQQVVGFDGDLFRPADLLWPEFPSQLSFDRKAEAVGAVDALMLKVPADGVGFFGIGGLHDQFPVVPPPLFGGAAQARQCRMRKQGKQGSESTF